MAHTAAPQSSDTPQLSFVGEVLHPCPKSPVRHPPLVYVHRRIHATRHRVPQIKIPDGVTDLVVENLLHHPTHPTGILTHVKVEEAELAAAGGD